MNSKLDSLLSHFHRTGLLCGVVDVLSKRISFTLCEKSELSHPVWNRVGGIFLSPLCLKNFLKDISCSKETVGLSDKVLFVSVLVWFLQNLEGDKSISRYFNITSKVLPKRV